MRENQVEFYKYRYPSFLQVEDRESILIKYISHIHNQHTPNMPPFENLDLENKVHTLLGQKLREPMSKPQTQT